MNIYVGNLNFKVEENQLKELFEEYGDVTTVSIIKDRETGRSRGFGFVEMPNDENAQTAIDELTDAEFMGKKMVLNEARPKPNYERRGNGGGNTNGGPRRTFDRKPGGFGDNNRGGGDRRNFNSNRY